MKWDNKGKWMRHSREGGLFKTANLRKHESFPRPHWNPLSLFRTYSDCVCTIIYGCFVSGLRINQLRWKLALFKYCFKLGVRLKHQLVKNAPAAAHRCSLTWRTQTHRVKLHSEKHWTAWSKTPRSESVVEMNLAALQENTTFNLSALFCYNKAIINQPAETRLLLLPTQITTKRVWELLSARELSVQ